ncbi:hypothetical protein [Epilithonimonas arachidiradicis]|uniref:Uncharacterized protein n=1 Tax=Epilithonimonas arachidiradicis TaxID=1617282 RepID=A0A420CLY0_9FLAO|nr:hypothetical protein [Epilithonimonas arachidiradicis]RKE79559.1 hypothetical protein BXY58_3211 [Epilithonimonas arachidiradicis]GGG66180.1 hypothetical protein GCM10007332_31030 [Epilithonimonas arachidiradicis]
MNLDIKRRIDTIAHPKAVRLFFNLIDQLITENNLSADDERLVLNVRNDSRKRFSVNINSRLVLYIKGGEEFGFMINKDDWHLFENIPHIDKDVFGNYEPASFNVSFSLDEFLNNQELITNYWLKSCTSYLPKQERSQYRKHHIEELYNIAKDSNLLDNYLSDSEQYYSKFKQVVYDFKDYIKSEDILIKDFEIQTVYDSYVWISDSKGIIGRDGFCHYELIVRNRK